MEKKEIFNKIKIVEKIAKQNLRDCYFDKGILASRDHFSDYWARDSFWAMGGILAIGDYRKARDIFELFFSYQRKDGKIPRKIMREYTLLKYLFGKKIKRKKIKPVYVGLIPPFHSMDENFLLIIAFEKYLQKTHDENFAYQHYKQLKGAVDWYKNQKKDGILISEYFLSSWTDTVFKSGRTLYTNVLYSKALKSFGNIARILNKQKDAQYYFKKNNTIIKKINIEFWNGKFYNNQIGNRKYFDTAGNILVGLFGIAPRDRSDSIIKKLVQIKSKRLLPTIFPKYSFWKINPLAQLLGMGDYHNGISWLWIDLLAINFEYKSRNKEMALKNLEEIFEIILREGKIYETYFNNGQVYSKLFWKSANPFAWNSGIFLEVCDIIKEKKYD